MHRRRCLIIALPLALGIAGCTKMEFSQSDPSPEETEEEVAAKPGAKDKNLPSVLERVAFRSMKSGNGRTAASLYRRVLEMEPNRRSAQIGLADSLVLLGEHANAASIYRKAMDADPNDSTVRGKLGRTLLSLDKPREALGLISQSMSGRQSLEGLNNIGIAYLLMGQPEKAKQYFRRAFDRQSNNPVLRNNLAVSLAVEGRSKEAMRTFGPVPDTPDSHPHFRRNLALVRAMERGRQLDDEKLALFTFGKDTFPFVVAAVGGDMRDATATARPRMAAAGAKSPTPGRPPSRGPRTAQLDSPSFDRQAPQLAQNTARSDVVAEDLGTPPEPRVSAMDKPKESTPASRPDIRPAASDPPAPAPKAASTSATPSPGYRVQLGAYQNQRNARAAGSRVLKAAPDLLDRIVVALSETTDGKTLFRIQTEDKTTRRTADALCAKLKARAIRCFVVPGNQG